MSEFRLLPECMAATLRSVVDKVECNPRSIKRLVNLLQIISEIAKLKPMTGLSSGDTIATWNKGEEWKKFSKKAVMWVFMAQYFTFRLSALVQVLLDFEQKRNFNEKKRNVNEKKIKVKNIEYGYVKTCRVLTTDATVKGEETNDVADVDEITILKFYQQYVEKYIHILSHSERLSRVDNDPEEFAFLLLNCEAMDVNCEDILGPWINSGDDDAALVGERRKDFALLSYSFNLNTAMRLEVHYLPLWKLYFLLC